MGDSALRIILDRAVYSPGDVIRGVVRIAASTDVDLEVDLEDGIQLDITGVAVTGWTERTSSDIGKNRTSHTVTKSRTEVLLEEHIVIDKSAGAQKDFRFTYQIPSKQFPMKCSIRSIWVEGIVKYTIWATIKMPLVGNDIRGVTEFDIFTPVYTTPDCNLPVKKMSVLKDRKPWYCFCCCFACGRYGPITIEATASPQVVHPGGLISVSLHVKNKSGVDLDCVQIAFEEKWTCLTDYFTRFVCNDIFEMKTEAVANGKKLSYQVHLQIPGNAYPTQKMCKIINHEYMLRVVPQRRACCSCCEEGSSLTLPIFVASPLEDLQPKE